MGVASSRELATDILDNVEKGLSLDNVLKNPKWKHLYQKSPPEVRRSILHITSAPKENCLSRLQQLKKSDIGISNELRPHFELWKNPRKFFDHNISVVLEKDTVSQIYVELRRIVNGRTDDPIRARIYAAALYDLRLSLDKNESLQLRPEIRGKIQQVIFDSPLIDDSLEDISKWTKMFLKFGERMKIIAAKNGGLGALMVIPLSVMSIRQWQRLSDAKFDIAVQHLQSIEVAKAAEEARSHTIASQIHGLILQKFIHEVVRCTDANSDEHMIDLKDTDEDSTNHNSTEDSDYLLVNNHSPNSNTLSISLEPSSQAVNPRQGCPQPEIGTVLQMTVDESVHHSHLASTPNQQINGIHIASSLDVLFEAADLVHRRNEHHVEGFRTMTPHSFQTTAASLPQQHGFRTDPNQTSIDPKLLIIAKQTKDPNQTSIDMRLDPPTSDDFPGAAWNAHVDSVETLGHLSSSYSTPGGTLIDPAEDSFWSYYSDPDGTLAKTTAWSSYVGVNGSLVSPTEGHLWNFYSGPNGTPG